MEAQRILHILHLSIFYLWKYISIQTQWPNSLRLRMLLQYQEYTSVYIQGRSVRLLWNRRIRLSSFINIVMACNIMIPPINLYHRLNLFFLSRSLNHYHFIMIIFITIHIGSIWNRLPHCIYLQVISGLFIFGK